MHFAIGREHLQFFYQRHFLELEGLLSPKEVEDLKKEIDHKLKACHTVNSLFMGSRDLWRESALIKKIVLSRRLADLVFQLTKIKPVRLAYSQCLKTPTRESSIENLPSFFHQDITLQEVSSIKNILCGVVIHLSCCDREESPLSLSIEEDVDTLCPMPKKPGSGIFFSSDTPLNFKRLFELPAQNYLLIAYAGERALYEHEENDPHKHYLKKLGYVFNDKLTSLTHPIVFN